MPHLLRPDALMPVVFRAYASRSSPFDVLSAGDVPGQPRRAQLMSFRPERVRGVSRAVLKLCETHLRREMRGYDLPHLFRELLEQLGPFVGLTLPEHCRLVLPQLGKFEHRFAGSHFSAHQHNRGKAQPEHVLRERNDVWVVVHDSSFASHSGLTCTCSFGKTF